jgi:hypothetical protein
MLANEGEITIAHDENLFSCLVCCAGIACLIGCLRIGNFSKVHWCRVESK